MTSQQAQEILLRYRPGQEEDPDDDHLQEALELAARDPELAAWFDLHCAMQKAVRTCFQQIEVPDGLKEQILSERKAYFAKASRRRAAVTVASILVITASIFFIIRQNLPSSVSNTFASFRTRMAGDVQRLYPAMDLETNRLDVIRDYLAQNQGHAQVVVPPALYGVPPTGCAILNWHGKRVSMICFNSGKNSSGSTPDLFLFVIQKSQVKAPPGAAAAEFNQIRGLATASWSSGDKVYVLGALGDEAFLKKYL